MKIETLPDIYKTIKDNQAKHKIKYVINSHIDYMDETLPMNLKHSIREFDEDECIIVVGGAEVDEVDEDNYFTTAYTSKNLYDFHSFVFVIEHPEYFEGYDYIFYMHDTCYPLPFFKQLSYNFPSGISNYRVWSKSNSNLGLYSVDYLKKNQEFILNTLGNIPDRHVGVRLEDCLMKNHDKAYNRWETLAEAGMGDKLIQVGGDPIGWKDPYGTGTQRRAMVYKNLNLVKFKSPSGGAGGYGGV